MLALLVLVFLAVPFVELVVLLAVGRELGVLNTIAVLLVVSFVGAWLVRREGLGVVRAVERRLRAGEMPGRELVDGLLVLLAGALLLTPGFVTDAVGVLLLLPPVRAVVRAALRRRFERRLGAQDVRRTGGRWLEEGP